ncbi:MAG: hypothetical protein QME28_04995 [Candidatus Saccharicenans sp.]|nr:hypothetical protein [Candidatus Saccharicenans sp.]
MAAALKNLRIRYFATEEAFCRYLEFFARCRGYVLVETSPLIEPVTAPGSGASLSAERKRGVKDERR